MKKFILTATIASSLITHSQAFLGLSRQDMIKAAGKPVEVLDHNAYYNFGGEWLITEECDENDICFYIQYSKLSGEPLVREEFCKLISMETNHQPEEWVNLGGDHNGVLFGTKDKQYIAIVTKFRFDSRRVQRDDKWLWSVGIGTPEGIEKATQVGLAKASQTE